MAGCVTARHTFRQKGSTDRMALVQPRSPIPSYRSSGSFLLPSINQRATEPRELTVLLFRATAVEIVRAETFRLMGTAGGRGGLRLHLTSSISTSRVLGSKATGPNWRRSFGLSGSGCLCGRLSLRLPVLLSVCSRCPVILIADVGPLVIQQLESTANKSPDNGIWEDEDGA